MKYCPNCKIKIDNDVKKCLFCDSELEELDKNYSSSFPTKKPKSFYVDKVKKILFYILVSLFFVSLLLTYYLFKDRLYYVFTLISAIYIYIVTSIILDYSKGLVAKISNITMLTAFYVIYVFYFFNLDVVNICLTYVYPGVCIVGLLAMLSIHIITKGKNIHDEFIYIFLNSLFGLTPFIFVIFKIIKVTFIASIVSTISLLILLAFILFVYKDSKDELKRRFHI